MVALAWKLSGLHTHIWQIEDGYAILVVSDNPEIADTLAELAKIEDRCEVHPEGHNQMQVMDDEEGYLLTVRGENAFIYVRLFLALDQTSK